MMTKKIPIHNRGSANRVLNTNVKSAVESTTLKNIQSTKTKIDEAIALLNSPLYTGSSAVKSQLSEKVHHYHPLVPTSEKQKHQTGLLKNDQERTSSISKGSTSKNISSLDFSDTPTRLSRQKLTSKNTADVSPMTREISRWTSLTKEKLSKEFHATLQMNVTARRKFCTAELRYARRDGNYETVKKAEKYLKDLFLMEEKTRNQVDELLKDYNKVCFDIKII